MVKEKRNLVEYILLSIVTCGIYPYIFIYELSRDINIICEEDGKKTTGTFEFILYGILTCGIYCFVWYYTTFERVVENARRYGIDAQENGLTFLLWQIPGCFLCGFGPFYSMYLLIKNMNALTDAYLAQKKI